MPHTVHADSAAPPEVAWTLLASPQHWHEWSPHVRGAWGLGTPQVQAGRRGAVRLLGVVPVPARITAVTPRSWTWKVGPVVMTHAVRARRGGTRITMTIDAPGPLGPAVGLAYGPVCALLLSRLARRAEAMSSSSGAS